MGFDNNYSILNYKKQVAASAPQSVSFSHEKLTDKTTRYHKIISSIPPWLEVYNFMYVDATKTIDFSFRIKENYALSMAEGIYTTQIKVRFQVKGFLGIWDMKYPDDPEDILTVSLEVQDTVLLSVTPTTKSFKYIVGNPLPQNEILQIVSEGNWNAIASQSWVTLSPTAGVGTGQLFFGVDPTGLDVGNYDAVVTIQDNTFTKTVVISLAVSEGDTGTSYLYPTPRSLEFISETGVENTKENLINLDVSHDWTATASATWLQLSAESGASGVMDIITTVDSTLLAIGGYSATITFAANNIIKKVYVTLNVIDFLTEGIESEALYFAADRNKLKTTNIENNTFLVLDVVTSNINNVIAYQQESPFFKGIAEIVIGQETNNLLPSVIPTDSFITRIKNNIQPINISLTAFTENKYTEATTQFAQFSNLRFLTGKTPETLNKLCYIPSEVYATNKAVLNLSILSEEDPPAVEITGAITATIGNSTANELYVYNAIVNLSDFVLITGDVITITFGTLVVNVVIKPTEPEVNIIAFENEWREFEFFEATGFLTVAPTAAKQTTELQVEGEKHTKVTTIDSGVNYVLNTGWVHTNEEKEWLTKILDAQTVFFYRNNEPVEIILTTKTLEVYKTREYKKAYTLKFKKAIV